MFDSKGNVDWTYYYAELTKARAERIKYLVIGLFLGILVATSGFVILVQYLQSLP